MMLSPKKGGYIKAKKRNYGGWKGQGKVMRTKKLSII
jgi:hypothetical protein